MTEHDEMKIIRLEPRKEHKALLAFLVDPETPLTYRTSFIQCIHMGHIY